MDSAKMFKAMAAISTFKSNHPKFFSFVDTVFKPGIPEGTVIELTVTKPGEESITTNIKVSESDLALFESLKGGFN
ncbi:MAG: hypothetical protein K6A38_01465 [Lachnospiraceae bacterium]|nr:hypothetical protein [Lachnospiraceae bacterium]